MSAAMLNNIIYHCTEGSEVINKRIIVKKPIDYSIILDKNGLMIKEDSLSHGSRF